MTSESAQSTSSSYLHVAVPESLTTQDIEEGSLTLVNVEQDDRIHCVTPRGRLPVCDSVSRNEPHLEVQVLPQQSVNTMALMNHTNQRSVHALSRVMSPRTNPNDPFNEYGANQSVLFGFEQGCRVCGQMAAEPSLCVECGIYGHPTCLNICLLYTSPSPRDLKLSRMPSSA